MNDNMCNILCLKQAYHSKLYPLFFKMGLINTNYNVEISTIFVTGKKNTLVMALSLTVYWNLWNYAVQMIHYKGIRLFTSLSIPHIFHLFLSFFICWTNLYRGWYILMKDTLFLLAPTNTNTHTPPHTSRLFISPSFLRWSLQYHCYCLWKVAPPGQHEVSPRKQTPADHLDVMW